MLQTATYLFVCTIFSYLNVTCSILPWAKLSTLKQRARLLKFWVMLS